MAKQYEVLSEAHLAFIEAQKVFFTGTSTADSRINVSPKGMDAFRVLCSNRVLWLNLTGSGNETSAHIQHGKRMTIMFCAFEGAPLILRLYGSARVIHQNDADWQEIYSHFEPLPGARQIFDLSVDMVQTSCGMGVPLYTYNGDRSMLKEWAAKKGEEGLQQYWENKNQSSIDNIPTHIVKKNLHS